GTRPGEASSQAGGDPEDSDVRARSPVRRPDRRASRLDAQAAAGLPPGHARFRGARAAGAAGFVSVRAALPSRGDVPYPRGARRTLPADRRLAATLHGSPLRTGDADICPAKDAANLERLARALEAMDARVRAPDAEAGVRFACDARFLTGVELLNLTTRFGDLDIAFRPAGTG